MASPQHKWNLTVILRSNVVICSQGFILQATASAYYHPGPASRVDQQAGSSRFPDRFESTLNGKRVTSHLYYRGTAIPLDGKDVEDAFWEKKPLQKRKVTPADVLTVYGMDTSSLRSGFFLQKLCLRNMRCNRRKITPDQVIQEFTRMPDRNHKYKLAIARFLDQCCLRRLPLHGQQVTPDAVVRGYQATGAAVALARFIAECCLRRWPLNGQPITPDMVVKCFLATWEHLGLARFKAECCLRRLPLNGWPVTPDAVVTDFRAIGARLEEARFKAECCLRHLPLNGQMITPDEVVKNYQSVGATLELARFKEACCLRNLPLNGQPVTPDAVVREYEQGGWWRERNIFCSHLGLSTRESKIPARITRK